jgi:hypothetical protein
MDDTNINTKIENVTITPESKEHDFKNEISEAIARAHEKGFALVHGNAESLDGDQNLIISELGDSYRFDGGTIEKPQHGGPSDHNFLPVGNSSEDSIQVQQVIECAHGSMVNIYNPSLARSEQAQEIPISKGDIIIYGNLAASYKERMWVSYTSKEEGKIEVCVARSAAERRMSQDESNDNHMMGARNRNDNYRSLMSRSESIERKFSKLTSQDDETRHKLGKGILSKIFK